MTINSDNDDNSPRVTKIYIFQEEHLGLELFGSLFPVYSGCFITLETALNYQRLALSKMLRSADSNRQAVQMSRSVRF